MTQLRVLPVLEPTSVICDSRRETHKINKWQVTQIELNSFPRGNLIGLGLETEENCVVAQSGKSLCCCISLPSSSIYKADRKEKTMLLYSRVIHIARIRHLLGKNSQWLGFWGVCPYNAMVNHILQVGEASPYIAQVVIGVVSGSGRPWPY